MLPSRIVIGCLTGRGLQGCHSAQSIEPIENFRAEVRKFLGVEWIVTGPKQSCSIPLAKRVSLLLISKVDDNFDSDINDIV